MTISLRAPSGLLVVLWGLGVLSQGCATARAPAAPAPVTTPAPPSVHLEAREADALFRDHRFQDGTVLPEVRIHYATLGTPRRDSSGAVTNAVLLLHWTSASGAVLRSQPFQDALFAPGRPLDATKYFLIFPDSVGHGRSSKPSDGPRTKFPAYGYRDMVELQHQLVTGTLGIRRLHAIVGLSMGGMNAWQWSELYPDAVEGVMPIVSLPTRIAGRNLLWRRFVVKRGRFVVQEGNSRSFGHLTQAHPELWADQVAAFLKFLEEP